MTQVAVFDAVNSVDRPTGPTASSSTPRRAHREAATASAAHAVLRSLPGAGGPARPPSRRASVRLRIGRLSLLEEAASSACSTSRWPTRRSPADAKYQYDLWRAIREADIDGNPLTEADPGWTPLLATPPFPSYTSGHSTFSGAASEVLGLSFGTDAVAFTLDGVGGPRSFLGFAQAAEEAGRSRVFGGIHFEFDNQAGLASGRAIGRHAF
ncbi:MAG: vanadium-dependent haloperoxidase, partial [Singulisphaera sp.]